MRNRRFFPYIFAATALWSCSTSPKPCAKAGDVEWNAKIHGDRMCMQQPSEDGRMLNHGKYLQYFLSGQVAIEGEFKWGRKNGVWIQYNEQGEKVAEKYFENGVERSSRDPQSK
jgi:hypothetical protein